MSLFAGTDRPGVPETRAGPVVDRDGEQAGRLRVACVYRNFNDLGSIHSLFKRDTERLSLDDDVWVLCAARGRAPTSAPLAFVGVEPALSGSGRFRYAVECATFALRADAAVRALRGSVDVVYSEGFATTEADVVRVHAVSPAETDHYFRHVAPEARLRWARAHLARPQLPVVRAVERRLFARSPLCLVPTRRVASELVAWHGLDPELIAVVPYGVDTKRFVPDPGARARLRAELGVPGDRFVALLVGAGFARKGVDRAVLALAESGLGEAELWVVGTDHDRSRFERIARESGVGERVRFVGAQPYAGLERWYAAADVFVLPSQQDTAPLTVTEALSCGLPAIVSEHVGSSEAVRDGVNGFCVAGSGEPEEIALRLRELADEPVRRAFAARSRQSVTGLDYDLVYPRIRELVHAAARRRAGAA